MAKLPLHTKILIGLLVGAASGGGLRIALGSQAPGLLWFTDNFADPLGQLFLRLLLMIVVPLVFSSLVVGVAGIGEARKLGRVALKTFGFTVAVTTVSVLIGLSLANTIRPGHRVDPEVRDQLVERYSTQVDQVSSNLSRPPEDETPLMLVVRTIVSTNPLASAAQATPDMLGLMCFALVFGIGLTLIPGDTAAPVISLFTGVYEAVAKIIGLIMRIAPVAVACLLFTLTARFGFGFLTSLGWYVATVLLGLGLHFLGVYSLVLKLLIRISPLRFFRRIRLIIVTAFSTSSSSATLPTALKVSEERVGVPRGINSFVLTVGATANQNGTALYEGVTALFLAQLAGVDLSLGQQLMVLYLAILGGIGTAGVPAGSLPFLMVILTTIGVNPELVAIIIGIDRFLDMCRTTLNVVGDVAAAAYVARSEGAVLLPDSA